MRVRFCAPASESYRGSSRLQSEHPWVGFSQENYSPPPLALQQTTFPNQQTVFRFSAVKICIETLLVPVTKPVPALKVLSQLHAHKLPMCFYTVILFSLQADATGMENDPSMGNTILILHSTSLALTRLINHLGICSTDRWIIKVPTIRFRK